MRQKIDEVIRMAWSDKISFEEIKKKIGVKEKEVIFIMRKYLKKSSYILWRKRVRGRYSKHRKKNKQKYYDF
tara:strand:- start:181 stop:396 length:216 start_codon:yes stop_codon:yes gene_type:complete